MILFGKEMDGNVYGRDGRHRPIERSLSHRLVEQKGRAQVSPIKKDLGLVQ